MTPYHPNIRSFVTIVVVVSILGMALLNAIPLGNNFEKYQSFIGPTSVASIMWVLWVLFDKYLWKWQVSRWLGLSKQPDISGIWIGDVDRLGEANPHAFEMTITQTFSKISISTRTNNSKGSSIKAYFLCDIHQKQFELVNLWMCRTKKRQKNEAYEEFKGLSQVAIISDGDKIRLEDYYFTDRNPPTAGRSMLVKKEQKK